MADRMAVKRALKSSTTVKAWLGGGGDPSHALALYEAGVLPASTHGRGSTPFVLSSTVSEILRGAVKPAAAPPPPPAPALAGPTPPAVAPTPPAVARRCGIGVGCECSGTGVRRWVIQHPCVVAACKEKTVRGWAALP